VQSRTAARVSPSVSAAIAAAAFLVYLITAAPTAYWLDSSELVAGGFELGIPHPPGHPLFVLMAKLSTLVPLGSVAFRVHLLSAGTLAVALYLGGRLVLRLWPRASWLQIGAMGLAAVSVPFWFHGVRAEVYPLHLLLAVGLVFLAVRLGEAGRVRDYALLGLVAGLGLANHHYLTLLMVPGLAWIVLVHQPSRRALPRGLPWTLAGGLLGLMPYLLIALRGRAFTTVRWGQVDRAEGVFWLISAKAFQKTADRLERVDASATLEHLWRFFEGDVGLVLTVLGALGLLLLVARRPRLGVGLWLLVGANLGGQVVFDFDPTNPDVGGYFLLTVWLLALGLAFAVGEWVRLVGRAARRDLAAAGWVAAALVLVVGLAIQLPSSFGRCNLASMRDTDHFADATYEVVPTDGVVVTAYFETIFNLWYREVVPCRRPDAPVVHRLFRTYPGYDDYLRDRYPALAGMLDAPPEEGQLDPRWLFEQAGRSGVLIEVDPTLDPRLEPYLYPAGLLVRLMTVPLPEGPFPDWLVAGNDQFWRSLYRRVDASERETAANLLWAHFNRATLLLHQHQPEAARWHLERAEALSPGDPGLEPLRRALSMGP
jgi:hypothetical protein